MIVLPDVDLQEIVSAGVFLDTHTLTFPSLMSREYGVLEFVDWEKRM